MTSQLETLREGLAGRYDVDSELGRGGMSIVYRARDLKHDRAVAIKVLHPELSSTLARERFHQEIALAAKLQHPNIVPVYDSGETGGLVFYVMPEVDGESLRERLAREPQLPLDEAVRIVEDVVEGLSHAHEQGIIHRDVKPGNILLTGGRAVVVDFGIARAASIAGGSKLTTSGIVLGTPAYMSPEQAVGERDIDRRTDVYSLGCVLYEMLAGEPPFTGPNAQAVIARQVQAPAPSLALVRPDLPIGVFDTVDRALAKARVDRFGTAEELRRALNEGAATARASGTRGPARNRLGTRALVALAVVLTVAGAAWRLFFTGGSGFDENRVMVFPLAERGDVTLPVGIGETVALAIGSALEGADPLRWIDGWLWLGGPEREDISRLTGERGTHSVRRSRADGGDPAHRDRHLGPGLDRATRVAWSRRAAAAPARTGAGGRPHAPPAAAPVRRGPLPARKPGVPPVTVQRGAVPVRSRARAGLRDGGRGAEGGPRSELAGPL
jgi:hypothetical protein